ncbi:hypothetical protein ACVWWQ_002286 [Rhodanobacter sp. TND4EL1]
MTFSLRLLARSRRLRAMGVLAWLMLVINSLAAAPMGMTGVPHSHAMQTAVAATSEHCHPDVAVKASRPSCGDQAGCHGGMTEGSCHCAAVCGTTLLPATTVVLASAATRARYAMPLPSSAPSLHDAPPLRPPAI